MLTQTDLADLKRAKQLLENPGLAAKITAVLGTPIEKGFALLPARWSQTVHKASKAGAPAMVRLIALLASRFGVVVSEKAAAQAIPILGAAGGALVNTVFIGHFQDMARGHFIVRRLEKIHGTDPVRSAYESV